MAKRVAKPRAKKSRQEAVRTVRRKTTGRAPDRREGATAPVAETPAPAAFRVVGLGASAGGLEAFEQFFRRISPDSGMAYVLVPHLDPAHASILVEILQRAAPIPVVEALDQMPVEPNRIHVIPPNRDMTIFHGILQLSVPTTPRGQRMPIDAFLRSLADDQAENAVGIVLSGTGTDGALGLRSIQGAGGVTLVQDPSTAKYDGMPNAAVKGGYAVHVLPPGDMPGALQAGPVAWVPRPEAAPEAASANGMSQLLMLLRSATGHDFSQYKKSTIGRRVERRMAQHCVDDMRDYARYVKEHPAEIKLLFRELLINVTSFFRDPEAFEALKAKVLPALLEGKPANYALRAWVAGCATGEEAYSLAISLREFVEETHSDCRVQIYATDLDEEAVVLARAGSYPPNIVQDISPERLRRFFTKDEAGYRVKKELREMVVFAIQNAIKDPPFTRLDLLACRNLLIYLEPELQERLVETFGYALKPGGALFLSPSESIGKHSDLFAPIDRKWKLFRSIRPAADTRAPAAGGVPRAIEAAARRAPPKASKEAGYAEITRKLLLQAYAPASVVTDRLGNILYVHGDTGTYLHPAPGHATLNVVEMAREGLQQELRAAFRGVAAHRGTAPVTREVSVRTHAGAQPTLLGVRTVRTDDQEELALVSFQEVSRAPSLQSAQAAPAGRRPSTSRREKALESALASAEELLRTAAEERQACPSEEHQASTEELQSINEELQSTNEELETSKEELQSVNEELVTVNAELQAKIEQLGGMQNDMKNLLDNVAGGVVFLDGRLAIRRFTREATLIFRVVAADVGRPLADIKCDVAGDELVEGARSVLDTLAPWERAVATTGGTSFLARIQPYRTIDNVIDGVVMTFADISGRVRAEAEVEAARDYAESIVETVREPLVVLDRELKVFSASRSFYQQFQVRPDEALGRPFCELGDRQWDIPALHQLLEGVLLRGATLEGYALEHDFPLVGPRRVVLNARRIMGRKGGTSQILLAMECTPPSEGGTATA